MLCFAFRHDDQELRRPVQPSDAGLPLRPRPVCASLLVAPPASRCAVSGRAARNESGVPASAHGAAVTESAPAPRDRAHLTNERSVSLIEIITLIAMVLVAGGVSKSRMVVPTGRRQRDCAHIVSPFFVAHPIVVAGAHVRSGR